jgi:hypothetical protein
MRSWFAARPWKRNYGHAPGASKTVRKRLIATRDRSRSGAVAAESGAVLGAADDRVEVRAHVPGASRASTSAFIVPNVVPGLSANPSANAWMIASLKSIRGYAASTAWRSSGEISSKPTRGRRTPRPPSPRDLGLLVFRDARSRVERDRVPHDPQRIAGHARARAGVIHGGRHTASRSRPRHESEDPSMEYVSNVHDRRWLDDDTPGANGEG